MVCKISLPLFYERLIPYQRKLYLNKYLSPRILLLTTKEKLHWIWAMSFDYVANYVTITKQNKYILPNCFVVDIRTCSDPSLINKAFP